MGIARSGGIGGAMKKALIALLFCLVPGSAGFPQSAGVPIVATPIPLDPADPARRTIGGLRYLGGWQLTSRQRDFGGYSALLVRGDELFALSDQGRTMRFRMAEPGMITDSRFGELPGFPGNDGRKGDRDAESMTVGPEGDVWVGFEYHNAIVRYSPDLTLVQSLGWPPAMKSWSENSGPEAMVRLEGGRFVVFAEGRAIAPHVHAALLFPGDPTKARNIPFQFGYRAPLPDYAPTDAVQLPDGRLVILHRRFGLFEGFSAAVGIADPAGIKPGAILTSTLVAELKPPFNIDNMEGISVVREGGRTILWMISDDNQIPIERTLLLKFELVG
ncbi:MAG: esterase-like activity of phytase family protein [Pseudomonadota bacterium]